MKSSLLQQTAGQVCARRLYICGVELATTQLISKSDVNNLRCSLNLAASGLNSWWFIKSGYVPHWRGEQLFSHLIIVSWFEVHLWNNCEIPWRTWQRHIFIGRHIALKNESESERTPKGTVLINFSLCNFFFAISLHYETKLLNIPRFSVNIPEFVSPEVWLVCHT